MFTFLKKLFGLAIDESLKSVLAENPFLVDVRTPGEFAAMTLEGAINIPLSEIPKQLQKFKGKSNIVVFCRSGSRSAQATAILKRNGFNQVTNGGSWQNVAKTLASLRQ